NANSITADLFLDPNVVTAGTIGITAKTSGGAASVAKNITASTTNVDVVTVGSDASAGTPPGTGPGNVGDLRYEMLNAQPGDTIVFNAQAMCGSTHCTITLSGPLPPIEANLTIDGGVYSGTPRMIVDGASTYRAFWTDSGTTTLANLEIANAKAQG